RVTQPSAGGRSSHTTSPFAPPQTHGSLTPSGHSHQRPTRTGSFAIAAPLLSAHCRAGVAPARDLHRRSPLNEPTELHSGRHALGSCLLRPLPQLGKPPRPGRP